MVAALTQQDVLVDDGDKSIGYFPSGQWKAFNNPAIYHGGTEHASYNGSANAIFAFTGTHVWFFGDQNTDHGRISLSVDGGPATVITTNSATYKPAQTALFDRDLESGPHVLSLTNLDDKLAVGVDYFAYRPVSAPTPSAVADVSVDASDSRVSHSGQWTSPGTPSKSYLLSYKGGASVSVSFEGSSFSYFADKNIDHGRFQVAIDDAPALTFSSYSPTLVPVALLFTRTNLTPGPHSVTITNTDDGKALGIDHFAFTPVVPSTTVPTTIPPSTSGVPPSTSSALGAPPSTSSGLGGPGTAQPGTEPLSQDPSSSSSSPSNLGQDGAAPVSQQSDGKSVSAGLIVGVVLGALAILLFAVLVALLLRKRVRKRNETEARPNLAVRTVDPWVHPAAPPGDWVRPAPGTLEAGLPSYVESTSPSSVPSAVSGGVSTTSPFRSKS